MTFGLISWLKQQFPDLSYEVPLWYPSREQPDNREWLVTNGLGGYASGTVSGAHRRRYHGHLVAALNPPQDRCIILSRVDELVNIDGVQYELATNHWASGVVSPTGYKNLESFTTLPVPTWVFELGGCYLIKQLTLEHHRDTVQIGYHWIPDPDKEGHSEAKITVRFLTGFRSFHEETQGSSDDRYPQFVSPNHSIIILNESPRRLCLTWGDGQYEALKQWWWDFLYPEESARALPDTEDLYLLGQVTADLKPETQFALAASLDKPVDKPDCMVSIAQTLARQKTLIKQAALPKPNQRLQILTLACDNFLVSDTRSDDGSLFVLEGYPWYSESGRAAMAGLPGLTLSTRRYEDAKRLLSTYSHRMVNGILPNKLVEEKNRSPDARLEYGAADVTLWWVWALHHYQKITRDYEFVKEQMPLLLDAARHYINGTTGGIKVDRRDGLLRCARAQHEFTWMDARVAGIPITPRSGKAVEICALWYNFLKTILFLAATVNFEDPLLEELEPISELCGTSMQKFWNADTQSLFDVIEPGGGNSSSVPAIRPNQLFAVSLPYRTFSKQQEKAILTAVEAELLTPQGVRSLAPDDPGYQGIFGCGFAHADQYHRDLSYYNGMAWPWLLGTYCDAVLNVYGAAAETTSRIGVILQPLLSHLSEEACLNSISELADGTRPQLPRGAFAHALAVAEANRWLSWQIRHQ